MKTLLKYDIQYFLKTPRLIIFLVLAFFLSALSAFTARYMNVILEYAMRQEGIEGITFPEPTTMDAYMQFFGNYQQIFVLVLIFIAVGMFTNDKTKNHYPFIFTHSIHRDHYVFSKLIVVSSIVAISVLLGALVFGLYTFLLFGSFDVVMFAAAVLVFMLFLLFLIVTVAMVSFSLKHYIGSVTIGVVLLFLLNGLTVVQYGVFVYFPHHLLNLSIHILEGSTDMTTILITLGVTMVFLLVLLVATIYLFRKKPLM